MIFRDVIAGSGSQHCSVQHMSIHIHMYIHTYVFTLVLFVIILRNILCLSNYCGAQFTK